MSSSNPPDDDHLVVSPMTMTSTPKSQSVFPNNRDGNAPEVVESSYTSVNSPDMMPPSTAVVGPHDSPAVTQAVNHHALSGDSEKESIYYNITDKFSVMAEDRCTSYPQAVSDLHAKSGDVGVSNGYELDAANSMAPQRKQQKILGMKRTLFYIGIALICIIVAVAVGAGVGATISKTSKPGDDTSAQLPKNETFGPSREFSSSSTTVSATSSPSTTITASSDSSSSSASAASSASVSAKPTFLNETSISSGYGFQGYSKTNYQSLYTEVVMEEDGTESGADFDFAVNSFQWIARMTNCCVSFCNNATDEGWIGYQCLTKDQPVTSEGFTRVWIWCNDVHQLSNARGRCSARRT